MAAPLILLAWTVSSARSPAQFPLDLIPTYIAAKLWLAGNWDEIYHNGAWLPKQGAHAAWSAMVQQAGIRLPDTAFVYSPVYLALVVPFAAFASAQGFFWGFATISAFASVYLGWETARLARVATPLGRLLIVTGTALSFPCSYAAMLGQNVIVAAALLLLGFRLISDQRPAAGTIALLLACAFKPWCAAMLLVLPLSGKHRVFGGAVVAYLLVFVLTPLSLMPSSLLAGYQRVLRELATTSVLAFNNVSLRALMQRLSSADWRLHAWNWAGHGHVGNLALAVETLLIGALYVALIWMIRAHRPTFERVYVTAMAALLLGLGVCWSHYLVLAIPVTLVAWCGSAQRPVLRGAALLLGVWMLLLIAPTVPSPAAMQPAAAWALLLSAPLLLVACVSFMAVTMPARRPSLAGSKVERTQLRIAGSQAGAVLANPLDDHCYSEHRH